MFNPIFIEYYFHEHTECYKMLLPWSGPTPVKQGAHERVSFHPNHTVVLCKVSEGYERACELAKEEFEKHLLEALKMPVKGDPDDA